MRYYRIIVFVALTAPLALAQPQATEPEPAEEVMRTLRPPREAAEPIPPVREPPAADRTAGAGAVPPRAPALTVMREGTYIVDRAGRLTRSPDSGQMEFTFEADGEALRDPPMVILPNLNLMAMENILQASSQDVLFRITGMVTEYRGRNYILVEKAVAVPAASRQF